MTLNPIVESFWRATWQGGLFAAAVWLFCVSAPRWSGRAVPASYRYWLYWIAAVQLPLRLLLVVPVAVGFPAPRPASVAEGLRSVPSFTTSLAESRQTSGPLNANRQRRAANPVAASGTPTIGNVAGVSSHATPSSLLLTANSQPQTLLAVAYLAGLAFCLGRQFVRMRRTSRMLGSARPTADERANRLLGEVADSLSMNPAATIALLESSAAPCPLLAGLLRPRIVLPEGACAQMSDEELRMTLAHEVAHLRRRDLWREVPTSIARTIFYFHPMLWLIDRELASACEEDCDAAALLATGGSRATYAKLLIRSAQGGFHAMAVGSSLGYVLLQRRLEMLKVNTEIVGARRRRWICVIALTAIAATPFTIVRAQTVTHVSMATKPAGSAVLKTSRKAKHARRTTKASKPAATVKPTPRAVYSGPVIQLALNRFSATQVMDRSVAVVSGRGADGLLVTAHFDSTPLRTALSRVFDAAGVDYSIKSDVSQDAVSCSVRKVSVASAVQTILQSVRQKLAYRVEGGTYFVHPREATTISVTNTSATAGDQALTSSSPTATTTSAARTQNSPGPNIFVNPPDGDGRPLDKQVIDELTTNQADVRQLLPKLFQGRGSFVLDPAVSGQVTVSLKHLPFMTVLQTILRQVNATYRIEGGLVVILNRTP